jgi:hypothetical protein
MQLTWHKESITLADLDKITLRGAESFDIHGNCNTIFLCKYLYNNLILDIGTQNRYMSPSGLVGNALTWPIPERFTAQLLVGPFEILPTPPGESKGYICICPRDQYIPSIYRIFEEAVWGTNG